MAGILSKVILLSDESIVVCFRVEQRVLVLRPQNKNPRVGFRLWVQKYSKKSGVFLESSPGQGKNVLCLFLAEVFPDTERIALVELVVERQLVFVKH